jgi:hypothetical protein
VEMTVGCPPSITATTLLVVPRSIPIIFAIERLLAFDSFAQISAHYFQCSYVTPPMQENY